LTFSHVDCDGDNVEINFGDNVTLSDRSGDGAHGQSRDKDEGRAHVEGIARAWLGVVWRGFLWDLGSPKLESAAQVRN
jgi:hypothetical protein